MWEALGRLQEEGILGPLDLQFARLMARLDGAGGPEVALAACLASRAVGEGHVCLDLAEVAGRRLAGGALAAPDLGRWRAALAASPVAGAPGERRPLVLDAAGRLYLYRYWDYERRLAGALLERAAAKVDGVDSPALAGVLDALFPPAGGIDWQRVAAATAVLSRLCIISGGPGTGKTATAVRILAALARLAPGLRTAMAAPTGKAAARLQASVRALAESMGAMDGVPREAATVHRLLGVRPGLAGPRYHPDNPLPLDLLVVDEASMIDLSLMARLVTALPPAARLVLLGDKDQLASVEAGAVLGDCCAGAAGPGEAFAARLEGVAGGPLPRGGGSALADSVCLLRRGYRFGAASGIGTLAAAVNAGDVAGTLAVLREGRHPDLAWRAPPAAALRAALGAAVEAGYAEWLSALAQGLPPERVLAAFERFRVLVAHRSGAAGVGGVNAAIEAHLHRRRIIDARRRWYPGRPVMVGRNDYELGLYNGDAGIALHDPAGGGLRVYFLGPGGEARAVPPARLPEHETAYAMTVHKSQGSEFERVLLLLPEAPSRATTRELLYTGITRARERLELWAPEGTVAAAAGTPVRRASGLRDRLWS